HDLTRLGDRFQTPTYVYSRRRLEENYRRFDQAFAEVPHLICYSIKANSNLKIISLLAGMGAGVDIVSGGELQRAIRAGADPACMVFSGVGKTAGEISAGLTSGLLMFNVESGGELDLIEKQAQALGKVAPVAVRINPNVEAETHPYVQTGQVVHKFGVNSGEARDLYRRAAASPHLEIRGVACHIGSQILEARPFLDAFDEIRAIADELRGNGIEAKNLDLGGGFGINYGKEKALDLSALAEGLLSRLRGTPYRLILEPGRAIVGDAGLLFARVLYVKRNAQKGQKSFIVLDAGMNDLIRPALYGSYHEILPVRRGSGKNFLADVVGPICETGDFLAQDREMQEVEPGDLLAILTAGAYGYVLSSNYNTRPRPAEVLLNGEQAELIRSRETVEDLLRAEAFDPRKT
ncbi:MAG: diaminopimelate decarboxylase, partial [Acidobacteriota bacterium]